VASNTPIRITFAGNATGLLQAAESAQKSLAGVTTGTKHMAQQTAAASAHTVAASSSASQGLANMAASVQKFWNDSAKATLHASQQTAGASKQTVAAWHQTVGASSAVGQGFTNMAGKVQQSSASVQKSATGIAKGAKDMSAATLAAGVAAGQVFADMAKKALSWAKESLGAFSSLAGEVRKMKSLLGGTAEDMSKLRFAADEVGVSSDAVTRSMAIMATHLQKNDDAAKRLGLSMTDAQGRMKTSPEILGEVSDKLNSMGNGLQRTAAAKELFGKGFAEMNPLLAQGSAGMKKFGEEAEKMGLVLSQKDLDASKKMKLAFKEMHASIEGIYVSIGRNLVPVMLLMATTAKDVVMWFRKTWTEGGALSTVLKVVAGAFAVVVAGMVVYMAVTKAVAAVTLIAEKAQAILNGTMELSPTGLIVAGILLLIAAFIYLVKTFKPVGDAVILVGKIIGTVIGWGISIALKGIKLFIDGLSSMMDAGLAVVAGFAKVADAIGGFFGFDTGLAGKVESVRNGLRDITGAIDTTLNSWADTAKDKGGEVGEKLAKGLVDAIKNLKMPTLGGKTPNTDLPTVNPPDAGGGGGGGKAEATVDAIAQRKQMILDFFTNLIGASRDALNAIRSAAVDARKRMDEMAKGIQDSLAGAFSISALTDSSFAQYLGVDALLAAFRKKLAAMRSFVANVKKLRDLGLPVEMLQDIVSAGVEGGAAAAQLIVNNPSSIKDLQALQIEMTGATAEAGATISQAVMGSQVSALTAQAQSAQTQFAGYLYQGASLGYQPTAADLSAGGTNISNEVNIDVSTNADPAEIAAAVAWALKTGQTLGMGSAAAIPAPPAPPITAGKKNTKLAPKATSSFDLNRI